jgi:hypothetical protein
LVHRDADPNAGERQWWGPVDGVVSLSGAVRYAELHGGEAAAVGVGGGSRPDFQ